jgi:hemolysin III
LQANRRKGIGVSERARLTLGKMQNPVRGFLHGSAAVISAIGGVALWVRAESDPGRQLALLVFAASLVGLYTASSLYHSVPWQPAWKGRMQRIDHSMIYVLVAGTYTPISFVVLDGPVRIVALGVVWGIAAVGIFQKFAYPSVGLWFSITMQMFQGWFAVLFFTPLAERLPAPALYLLGLGGILYSAGMVMLVTERPNLWPHVFSYHEVFHVFVIGGSVAHYTMTILYVAPFVLL